MIRTLSFGLILLVALIFSPVWSVPLIVLHMLRYSAYELLILAVCIDVYFGAHAWPYYTLVVVFGLVVITFVRPYVTFFETV